jgi:hypothetical protein
VRSISARCLAFFVFMKATVSATATRAASSLSAASTTRVPAPIELPLLGWRRSIRTRKVSFMACSSFLGLSVRRPVPMN